MDPNNPDDRKRLAIQYLRGAAWLIETGECELVHYDSHGHVDDGHRGDEGDTLTIVLQHRSTESASRSPDINEYETCAVEALKQAMHTIRSK